MERYVDISNIVAGPDYWFTQVGGGILQHYVLIIHTSERERERERGHVIA